MKIIETKTESPGLDKNSCILDITASGRFWRTSNLEAVSLITKGLGLSFISEKESDEYDMLASLSERLEACGEIITFNGNSFDLPHLKRKYAAYGMPDPLQGKNFRDLFLEYRPLKGLLSLESGKLESFAAKLPGFSADMSDAEKTLLILAYDALLSLFRGEYEFESVSDTEIPDALVFMIRLREAFRGSFSTHDEIYHLLVDGQHAALCAHLREGKLRCYLTGYSDYYFLPREGYAVHKTIAEYVDPSRKEKAVRENCFNLVSDYKTMMNDRSMCARYIRSALQFLYHR